MSGTLVALLQPLVEQALKGEPTEVRPWGSFTDLHRSDAACLKVLEIQPGQRLSLQRHFQREETWWVLSGRGRDEGIKPFAALEPGVKHHIPVHRLHRIVNNGKVPLVILELQLGHCAEDDIERLEDDHGRVD